MRLILIALVLVVGACGDLRTFEQTAAQFEQDREQLELLSEAIIACDQGTYFEPSDTSAEGCVGGIQRDLARLGYHSAMANEDRSVIEFRNGDDGTGPMGSVMSGIAYSAAPVPPSPGYEPLTEPPHHWFYFQHD